MKARIITICLILFVFSCVVVFAQTNTGVRSSVGSPTTPVSSGQPSLHSTPGTQINTGNRIISGNVGGGRHFRGIVPYSSTRTFGGRLGNTSVENFLRRSSGSPTRPGSQPFYSPRETVTGGARGTRTGVGSSSRVNDRLGSSRYRIETRTYQPGTAQDSVGYGLGQIETSQDRRSRPLSRSLEELRQRVSTEVKHYPGSGKLPDQQTGQEQLDGQELRQGQQEGQQLRLDPDKLNNRAESLKEELMQSQQRLKRQREELQSGRPDELQQPQQRETQQQEPRRQPDQDEDVADQQEGKTDVYKQMKKELDNALEKAPFEQITEDSQQQDEQDEQDQPQEDTDARKERQLKEVRARGTLGRYDSFATYSKDQFNAHLRKAEQYLKEGKYYRAADAYTVASVYQDDDPLVAAGKSFALFGAGEYLSSALFLSRAIENFPAFLNFDIDIEKMFGGRDPLESRIAAAEKWREQSEAGELDFVLGYIYHQMGRTQKASQAINAAAEKMPEVEAVQMLQKTVDQTSD